MNDSGNHRIYAMSVASVYRHYVVKVEKKGRSQAELDEVICWLTGYSAEELAQHLSAGTNFTDFFALARLNPKTALITGLVCGVRVEQVEHPPMRQIRYMDKLVDELARGWKMDRVLRG
jgi:hypothetical protein